MLHSHFDESGSDVVISRGGIKVTGQASTSNTKAVTFFGRGALPPSHVG